MAEESEHVGASKKASSTTSKAERAFTHPESQGMESALAVIALIAVTAAWGSTFFLIKDLVETMPPVDFLGLRFGIAAVFIVIFRFRSLFRAPGVVWFRGTVLGAIYAAGQLLQTIGLQHTDASVSGFITGMYVVLTPVVLFLVFRVNVRPTTWGLILVATAGLMILSLDGFAIGFGEMITFLSAVMFALHIVMVGYWAPRGHVMELGVIQVVAVGALSFLAALPGGVVLPQGTGQWASMLYMALVAGLLAIVLQTWAQARIKATSAAIIMTLEPLFAAAFAVAFGGENLTIRLLVGGGMILVAMFGAELLPTRRRTRTKVAKATATLDS